MSPRRSRRCTSRDSRGTGSTFATRSCSSRWAAAWTRSRPNAGRSPSTSPPCGPTSRPRRIASPITPIPGHTASPGSPSRWKAEQSARWLSRPMLPTRRSGACATRCRRCRSKARPVRSTATSPTVGSASRPTLPSSRSGRRFATRASWSAPVTTSRPNLSLRWRRRWPRGVRTPTTPRGCSSCAWDREPRSAPHGALRSRRMEPDTPRCGWCAVRWKANSSSMRPARRCSMCPTPPRTC